MTAQELINELRGAKYPTDTFALSNSDAVEMVNDYVRSVKKECRGILRDWLVFVEDVRASDAAMAHWLDSLKDRTRSVLGEE